jgi:hypothetical protein
MSPRYTAPPCLLRTGFCSMSYTGIGSLSASETGTWKIVERQNEVRKTAD